MLEKELYKFQKINYLDYYLGNLINCQRTD